MTETAIYPIAEVQGLYRTISELRQQVAAADLYRTDAMERMQQQDQMIDALKARISELTATLTWIKDLSQTVARLVVDGLSEAEEPSRDYTGHINLMGALGDPDYMRGSLSCRHVDHQASEGESMTTPEEVQVLRDTITVLRQRIADLESAQTLGAADRVILRAMEGREMTRAQIGEATNMHKEYVQVRVHRLAGMGLVEKCGAAPRPKGGSGQNPVLWRIKA